MITCLDRTDILALLCDVSLCFVIFPYGFQGQEWYLIVSFPEFCLPFNINEHYRTF